MIILSICIATYNRAYCISETLDSIVPQLNSNVELIIYDGNSTDNTSEVISNYLTKSENIKYIKGDFKGGVDQDYSKCVDFAKGEMIFLFTDDDLLLPNTINYILSICKKNVSLIILNSEVKNKYLTKKLKKSLLSITNDTILNNNDLNSLYKLTIPYISFIGCVIIKKSEWQSRNPHKYFGSEFVHVGVIFEKYFELKMYVSSRISITIRLGNEQWSARAFEIWIFKWQSLISSFNLISIELKKRYSLDMSSRRIRDIIVQKSKGNYNYLLYKKYFKNNKINLFYKILLYIISILPHKIFSKIVNFYLICKKIENLNI